MENRDMKSSLGNSCTFSNSNDQHFEAPKCLNTGFLIPQCPPPIPCFSIPPPPNSFKSQEACPPRPCPEVMTYNQPPPGVTQFDLPPQIPHLSMQPSFCVEYPNPTGNNMPSPSLNAFDSAPPPVNVFNCPPPPPMNAFSSPPPTVIITETSDNWLNQWLSKFQRNNKPIKAQAQQISISGYKKKLNVCLNKINEIEGLHSSLIVLHKSLTDEEWSVRVNKLNTLRSSLDESIKDVKTIPTEYILKLLSKRKRKRERLKRKKKELAVKKERERIECEMEHARIDLWLENMKEDVERSRREEEVKVQADNVLSGVFKKKADGKRMLNLLTTLAKLRNSRIQNRAARGEFVSEDAASKFNEIIDKLKQAWLRQMREYNVEEQGLRVMLNDVKVEPPRASKEVSRKILKDWTAVMFGHETDNSYRPTSWDELVTIRTEWDKHATEDETGGSAIPVGWIIPVSPSSPEWQHYIQH